MPWKILWTLSFRGRRSRNKVSVGEPAEGSFAWKTCLWTLGVCCASHLSWGEFANRRAAIHNEDMFFLVWSAAVFFIFHFLYFCILNLLACSAMDSLAQSLMKDAVNCDKHSDLQNSANQLDVECGLRFWVSPESRSPSSFDNSAWSGTLCCKQAKAVDFGWHAITFLALWMLLQICWVFDRRCNYLSSCMCILPLPGATSFVSRQTWCEINRPAEFKHISKQRTANWKGFLQ